MPYCCNFMKKFYNAALMLCDVAALVFQAHANYGTWSIDFENKYTIRNPFFEFGRSLIIQSKCD